MAEVTLEIGDYTVGFDADDDGNVVSCLLDGMGNDGMNITVAPNLEACVKRTRELLESL